MSAAHGPEKNGRTSMTHTSRRSLLKGGAALGLAGATNLFDFAQA
jgi:hypothetical protein